MNEPIVDALDHRKSIMLLLGKYICIVWNWIKKKILWSLGFKTNAGTSLAVQWLRCHAPNAGDPGSMPGQGTSSHMRQLKVHTLQRRPEILCATAKAQQSQLNTFKYIKQ